MIVWLALIALAVNAQIRTDPVEYLETARATADIARVFSRFNEYLENNDPFFLMHGDVNIPLEKGTLSSYAGDLSGEFQGFDAFVFIRLLKLESFSARFFGTWSNFGFRLDDATMAENPFGFTDKSRTGWITGYALFGAQASVDGDRYTLGAILRNEPTISEGPPAQFSYYYDGEGDFRTTEMRFERIYADASISGWRLDTLLSLEAIERLAAAKLFDLAFGGLSLGPAAQYLGRIESLRPGFELEWVPLPWFEARAAANLAVGGDGIGLGEALLDLSFPIVFADSGDGNSAARNLVVRLDARGSLLERSGRLVPGGKIELSVDNVHGLTIWDWLGLVDVYLGASAGISWNHADTLSRMPFEDCVLVYFKIQAALY